MARTEQVLEGDEEYGVTLTCPSCAATERVTVELRSRLERTRGESTLGLKVKAGKRRHVCGQTAIVSDTGEIISLDGDR